MEILFGLICAVLYLGGILGLSESLKNKNVYYATWSTISMLAGASLIAWMVVA